MIDPIAPNTNIINLPPPDEPTIDKQIYYVIRSSGIKIYGYKQ